MIFNGIERVKKVYPLWLVIYFIIFSLMIYLEIRIPWLLLAVLLIFMIKGIALDYLKLKVPRKRVYWSEHAPFSFFIIVVGVASMVGISYLEGYVYPFMVFIAIADFILDVQKDLHESPEAYGK